MSDAPQTTPASMVSRKISVDATGAKGFLEWLRASMPAVYRDLEPKIRALQAKAKAASEGTGLGAFGEAQTSITVPAGTANASSGWADNISKLIAAWGQYKLTDAQLDTVKKITDANLQRAQQGLAPLPYDASQLGLAPTVNVGLSGDTGKLVMYGGAALLGFLVLNSVMKHRRA